LVLLVFVGLSIGTLRLVISGGDPLMRRLTWLGFTLLALAGLHDVLREIRLQLLPLNLLPLAGVALQVAAFVVMALYYARSLTEQDFQRRQLQQLQAQVERDALSGLHTRKHLEDFLDSNSGSLSGGLMFIDIDHFKAVNDRFGHAVGDELIQAIAHCLKRNLRLGDVASRWGGDEFVVFLADINVDSAMPLLERLQESLSHLRLTPALAAKPTVSIGFAFLDGADWRGALARADEALYGAKVAGRNAMRIA
jgi:diguanylate cyclase (GGDEF)-like protein